jgi:hypothetical protein
MAIAGAVGMAAAGFAIFAASPAHADTAACVAFIQRHGYIATQTRIDACKTGASSVAGAWVLCYTKLNGTGMARNISSAACDRAGY